MIVFEVGASVGNQLFVDGMIDGLDAGQPFDELRLMPMHMLDQLGFRVGGAGDQNRGGVRDGIRDAMQEIEAGENPATAINKMQARWSAYCAHVASVD